MKRQQKVKLINEPIILSTTKLPWLIILNMWNMKEKNSFQTSRVYTYIHPKKTVKRMSMCAWYMIERYLDLCPQIPVFSNIRKRPFQRWGCILWRTGVADVRLQSRRNTGLRMSSILNHYTNWMTLHQSLNFSELGTSFAIKDAEDWLKGYELLRGYKALTLHLTNIYCLLLMCSTPRQIKQHLRLQGSSV